MIDTALVIAIAAAVAFSAVEVLSGPLKLRAVVNRLAVRRWMLAGLRGWVPRPASWLRRLLDFLRPGTTLTAAGKHVERELTQSGVEPEMPETPTVERRLCALATGGGASSLFRLGSDQLAAQINAAAEAVLDRPRRHAVMLVGLAKLDRREALGGAPGTGPIAGSRFLFQESTINPEGQNAALLDARHELTLRIQRRLDDLQIKTRSYHQIVNLALCVFAGVAAVAAIEIDEPRRILPLGVMAGFIAPLLARPWQAR